MALGSLDLTAYAALRHEGSATLDEILSVLLRRLSENRDGAVWIFPVPEEDLRAQAKLVAQRLAKGEYLPLCGVPFAVKDNIDVQGYPTTAACPAFSYIPGQTAPVVQRLLDAGALLVGKTNLDQFAAGLAGDRSPFGTPRNAFSPDRISGGSSSGSAVAVAAGLVSFALGTDTAGSGRVPAGCNNIVGLKPTPGLLDTQGIVPACQSLDCISIFALTVNDAAAVFEIAAGKSMDGFVEPRAHAFAFAVPRQEDLEFFGDQEQADLFAAALERLEQMGGKRVDADLRPLREVASLLYDGPWLAERLAGLEPFFMAHTADVHPVTRAIIEKGSRFTGVDVFKAFAQLRALRGSCASVFSSADFLVVPTMPTIPTLQDVQADSEGWGRRLGYYTNFVNLLGWAALAVPSGFTPNKLPGGITLVGPGGSDRRLCQFGAAWQQSMGLPLGATGYFMPVPTPQDALQTPAAGFVRVAVAGAHLRGQPFHAGLLNMGARFVRSCRTAMQYRFVALMHLSPPRPGLIRDAALAGSTVVEVYEMPYEGFGKLVSSVAPPLAIGTIELADGEQVKGFLCESWAAADARDITDFGSWIAFLESDVATAVRGKKGSP